MRFILNLNLFPNFSEDRLAASRLLEVENLYLYYFGEKGIVRAVDGVSLVVNEGEVVGIVGESGCGKSSLANAIMKNLPRNVAKYEGRITIDGQDIVTMELEEVRRRIRWKKISIVFQGAMNVLNPVVKVGHQIAEPLIVHEGMRKNEAFEKAREIMSLLGLPSYVFARYPHELSGGMKQRVVIATAMITSPKLLILDEPTSALDVSIQAQIMNLLKRLKRELNLSMIFITHDIALSSDICDRICVMYAGEIVEDGPADYLLTSPKHPYTQKLIAATPRLRSDVKPLYIPGAPPDLTSPPSGCRFHPRCEHAEDVCKSSTPPSFVLDGGSIVRCWLYGGNDGKGPRT